MQPAPAFRLRGKRRRRAGVRLPPFAVGDALPGGRNSLHTRILSGQIAASAPTKKRIWREIVREKIWRQADICARATGRRREELARMADKVRSGDPDNVESRAARFYWPALFGRQFRRNTDAAGINTLLNYGYAILRAATARAVAGAGLHPALGVHHRNQYDPFCLADDLMEPLRPLADWRVWKMVHESGNDAPEISPETKRLCWRFYTLRATFRECECR